MDITLTKNQLDFLCEKYLLDNYNEYLNKNNLKHSNDELEKFSLNFLKGQN